MSLRCRWLFGPFAWIAYFDQTPGDHVIHNPVYMLLIVASFLGASDQS